MPKLPRVSARAFARVLQRAGFRLVRQSGSHAFFRHPNGRIVNVPMHVGDMKTATIAAMLKASGLTVEELIELL